MLIEQIAVVVALLGVGTALVLRRVSPTVGISGALLVLFVVGVTDADTAFAGFSSNAPLTVAALYVVAGGVQQTGALSSIVRKLAGDQAFGRVVVGSAFISAFVANTPVVAVLIQPVIVWAKEKRRPVSQLLIPLSYATILGGMTTLIGTSTNLIGSSVVASLGQNELSFFEPARFGLPVAVAGITLALVLGSRVLPDRGGDTDDDEGLKKFTVSCSVTPNGPLDGLTVEEASLRGVPGLFLVASQRSDNHEVVAPVSPNHHLQGGDTLSFAGGVEQVLELHNRPGLRFSETDQLDELEDGQHAWFEAIVGNGSSLVGRTLKQAGFRSRYQAAVVALQRSGRAVPGRLGDERLRIGDSLLIVADSGFAQRWRRRSDFVLIRRRSEPPPTASSKSLTSLLILALVVMLSLTQVTDVLRAAAIGSILTVLTGVLTPRQARNAIDLNVVVLIGAAIGLGHVVTAVGIAENLATLLATAFEPFGLWGIALGLTLATLFLTELVTNAAAVAITVPIAVAAAEASGGDPRAFALGTIAAASASFMSPIGYQTNTMVYGPGRYQFTDYLRLGTPITAAVLAIVPALMANG